jgi:HlyD family secretion protein
MDVPRLDRSRRHRHRRYAFGFIAVAAVIGMSLGLSALKPAAPRIDRSTILIDTVKRGPLLREVRGPGTLVPEDIRWIPATTQGRIERIRLRPGTPVRAGDVILDLSNPQLDQELVAAQLKVTAAEAALLNLRAQAQNDTLTQEAATAGIEAEYKKAVLLMETNQQLAHEGLVADATLKRSQLDADSLKARYAIAQKQLASFTDSSHARVAVQESELEQARAMLQLTRQQVDDLHVRAGFAGVLQLVPVDVGQQVAPGTNLARVADPLRLKAEIRIPEMQAKDIQPGQAASIDTGNGKAAGRVVRVDPSVQDGTVTIDVTMIESLPKGARPELSVDGTIEIERLQHVLYVGRPAQGQSQHAVMLFKLQPNDVATRVQVQLGVVSANAVEIRGGLAPGDQVVLSDMSNWNAFEHIRLQ